MEVGKIRKRIMAMFLVVWVITATGQTVYAEGEDGPYASNPIPADGEIIDGDIYEDNIYTILEFTSGDSAVKHTAYFSDKYEDVANRIEDANLGKPPYASYPTRYYVGLPYIPPYIVSLVRGVTYYWCVDETDAMDNTYPGDIWEFTVRDYKASFPDPPDEATVLGPDVLLSWGPGFGVEEHDVYFGTDFSDVNNAVYSPCDSYHQPEYLGTVEEPNKLVTGLSENTMYYWRVDEVHDRMPPPFCGGIIYKGDVWCFKTAGLTAHWKFDEGSGTIAYDSAGNNDGTIYGAEWASGIIDGALDFDGEDDYVEFASVAALEGDNLTALAWVRMDESAGVWSPIIMQHDLNSNGYHFYVAGSKPAFYLLTGPSYVQAISPETINAEQWYHIAGSNDGSNLKLYVDGQLKDSKESSGLTGVNYNAYIGFEHTSMLYYKGLIDDVHIYNRALSAAEVMELYAPVESGPVAHWKFDEGTGSIAYDSAGNNDGTIYGAQWTTGIIDGALDFDGDGDYVELAPIASFGGENVTAQAWIRVDEFAGLWNPVLTQIDSSGNGYYFYIINNKPSFYIVNGAVFVQVVSTEMINADKWYQVAGTNDGSNLKLYVDGQLKDSKESSGLTGVNYNAYIGLEPTSMLYYKGLIDDVRIYNRALSAEEIEELYNSVTEPPVQDYKASSPNPPDEAVIEETDVMLSWSEGIGVVEHDVYFGTDFDDVNNAVYSPCDTDPPPEYLVTVEEPYKLVTGLSENTTYYWRVDEVSGRLPPPFCGGTIYKGDVWSFTIFGMVIPVQVTVDFDPDILNLASQGNWITSYIGLPEDYSVADIDPGSILLEGEIEPQQFWLTGDQQIAIVRFARSDVQAIVEVGEVELTITGQLTDGTLFEAKDTIEVVDNR